MLVKNLLNWSVMAVLKGPTCPASVRAAENATFGRSEWMWKTHIERIFSSHISNSCKMSLLPHLITVFMSLCILLHRGWPSIYRCHSHCYHNMTIWLFNNDISSSPPFLLFSSSTWSSVELILASNTVNTFLVTIMKGLQLINSQV